MVGGVNIAQILITQEILFAKFAIKGILLPMVQVKTQTFASTFRYETAWGRV